MPTGSGWMELLPVSSSDQHRAAGSKEEPGCPSRADTPGSAVAHEPRAENISSLKTMWPAMGKAGFFPRIHKAVDLVPGKLTQNDCLSGTR